MVGFEAGLAHQDGPQVLQLRQQSVAAAGQHGAQHLVAAEDQALQLFQRRQSQLPVLGGDRKGLFGAGAHERLRQLLFFTRAKR